MTFMRTARGPLLRVVSSQLESIGDPTSRASSLTASALLSNLVDPEQSLPSPPASDRAAWQSVTAPELVARAEADRETPWPQPRPHDAARYHRDGDRRSWETAAFARVQRSSRSVVAAAITGDPAWLPEVLDGAVLLCEQSSWCWPAHDESHTKRGWALPDMAAPVVDLGAGEMAAHLTWLDHTIGRELEAAYPGIRSRIRHEVRTRVLDPFMARDDWWWLGESRLAINWNPWILGNVLAAALRLLDAPEDAEYRAQIVGRVIAGLDNYVADLPEDGAIDEGYHYWWEGSARLLEALNLLHHATGGRVDAIAEIPAVRNTVAFPHRMQLSEGWFVSVSDSRARSSSSRPWRLLERAAETIEDRDAAAFARAHTPVVDADETMNLARIIQELTGAVETRTSTRQHPPLPSRVWLPSTQMLLAREHGGSPRGLTVVAKGGHNAESHNHNDVGSVIVASDGIPVIVDAGRPTYTAETFGENRYRMWMMQSDWHSVPVIAGHSQGVGREFAASDVSPRTPDATRDDALSLELAGAYGLGDRMSWRRTVRLGRGEREVIVRDAWSWHDEHPGGTDEVRFLLAGEVTLGERRATVVPLDGASPVEITWAGPATGSLLAKELDDPTLVDVWGTRLTRLDIDVSAVSELAVTIRQTTVGDRGAHSTSVHDMGAGSANAGSANADSTDAGGTGANGTDAPSMDAHSPDSEGAR